MTSAPAPFEQYAAQKGQEGTIALDRRGIPSGGSEAEGGMGFVAEYSCDLPAANIVAVAAADIGLASADECSSEYSIPESLHGLIAEAGGKQWFSFEATEGVTYKIASCLEVECGLR